MWPIATHFVAGLSVCWSVGHDRQPSAKTAEPVEMPFWMWIGSAVLDVEQLELSLMFFQA